MTRINAIGREAERLDQPFRSRRAPGPLDALQPESFDYRSGRPASDWTGGDGIYCMTHSADSPALIALLAVVSEKPKGGATRGSDGGGGISDGGTLLLGE